MSRKKAPSRLLTDAVREVRNTRSRFLSLLVLSALAVCFLAGLRATAPDMKETGDLYFDQQRLMDLRVVSTLGLTEEDVELLARQEGVEEAEGAYTIDAAVPLKDQEMIVKVHSFAEEGSNRPRLVEGRLPRKAGECLVEPLFLEKSGLSIGDTIRLDTGTGDFEDALARREFTIVGTADSPLYISVERGSSSLGTGAVSAFVLLPQAAFSLGYYTDAYLRAEGAEELLCYSEDYTELVNSLSDALEPLAEERSALRGESIREEAEQALADARRELSDGEAEVSQELSEGEAELTDARRELDDGWAEYYDGLNTFEQETADAQREIDDGEAELADALTELRDGEQEYQDALPELEDARREVADARQELADARAELDDGWAEYRKGYAKYEYGLAAYTEGMAQYEQGLAGVEQMRAGAQQARQGAAQAQQGAVQAQQGAAQAGAAAQQRLIRFVLHRQGCRQQCQHQPDAQQPADVDAVNDRLPQRRAQNALQPERTLRGDRAQQELRRGGQVAADVPQRERPDGIAVGVRHQQLVGGQPAAHAGQRKHPTDDGQHNGTGQPALEQAQLFGVILYLFIQTARQCQQQDNAHHADGQKHLIRVAGGIDQLTEVGGEPQAARQHEHGLPDQLPGAHARAKRAPDKFRRPHKVVRRDDKAEQHHRQVDGLGRADSPAEGDEQDFFPPHSFFGAQPQAERRVAEHHAQHRRIGRETARQLQRHRQQCRPAARAAPPGPAPQPARPAADRKSG